MHVVTAKFPSAGPQPTPDFPKTKTMPGGVSPIEDHRLMNESANDTPWEICYRQLAPKLLLFARQWLASPADAEDVVQAAFVKFWQRQPAAQPEHYPLLYAAVRSCALDFRRSGERRHRREANPDAEVLREDAAFFDHAVEQREEAALVELALRELPPEQREVVVLRVWGGLTFAEIATALDESINTISSRYRYALAALRRDLKPYTNERL
jgi:RNA polymerase sigma-70 factor (ECF subfamily)